MYRKIELPVIKLIKETHSDYSRNEDFTKGKEIWVC